MLRPRTPPPSIDIEFYEQGTPSAFATSTLPLDELPDSFQIHTTLNIQGDDWRVAGAAPATKAEFRRSGVLRVFVVKPVVEGGGSADILFNVPTLSNDIPAADPVTVLDNVFVVPENDWRQCELVSVRHRDSIEAEFDEIRQIVESQRVGTGYRQCHLRAAIRAPLDNARLTIDELRAALGVTHRYAGVAFRDASAVMRSSFAFVTSHGLHLWGQVRADRSLAVVCLQPHELATLTPEAHTALDGLLATHGFALVDWVRMKAHEAPRDTQH